MNLSSFKEFCDERNKAQRKQAISKFVLKNKDKISIGLSIASTIEEFAKTKNKFTLAKGGFSLLKTLYLDANWSIEDWFNYSNGWYNIANSREFVPIQLLVPIIKKFPSIDISGGGRNDNYRQGKIYKLPIGDVGLLEYNSSKGDSVIYYNNQYAPSTLIDFLIEEKAKELNSNFISFSVSNKKDKYGYSSEDVDLYPLQFRSTKSIKSEYYINFLKKCIDGNICRSILFYGPPGTGKTTLSQTIAEQLNLRTLKLKLKDFNNSNIIFLIEKFKFEAILIDDLDQLGQNHEILDFLEDIRSNVKIILGTCNSLKDFHPAVIRPGRFDQIVKIDQLEEEIISNILGKNKEKYFETVKNWPIAYVNELIIRHSLYSEEDMENHLQELDNRVKDQLKNLAE